MKLKKLEFDEEKMSQEWMELVEEKNLTQCKPDGVGVFSFCDGPPAAGGGVGVFLWFKNWNELFQMFADYFIASAPGPFNDDHEVIYQKVWKIFNGLAEGKIHRDEALGRINAAAKSYSQIEWWGTLDELCEGQGEFEKKVRRHCLRDSDGKSFIGNIGPAEKKRFMEAIAEYGF